MGTEDNTFGIVLWNVVSVLDGNPSTDQYDNVTITGTYEEEIEPNKTYTILAKEKQHEKYGMQYELMFIGEVLNLSNKTNQRAFLKTFLTDLQIEEMFKVLSDPLDTIQKHDVESLCKVHGVGNYISNCIIERFEENKDNCNVYIELSDMGLTPKFIQKLISRYKNANTVIDTVKNNPYKLSFDVEGIGFKTADSIAIKNGISRKSSKRVGAYINYLLNELGENGNSYITSSELTSYIFEEFGGKDEILDVFTDKEGNVTGNNINGAIQELVQKNILVVEDTEPKSERRVYLKKYYDLELKISTELKRIMSGDNNFEYGDWQQRVKEIEKQQGFEFTDEQIRGIELGINNQINLITGVAGSGKTSVVSGILTCLEKYSFAQTSLSGKAAARMQEITGSEGSTIHRLLGFNPQEGFQHNKENPLKYNIIILDEISLVGGDIFLKLIEAIPDNSKLIILGDMGQLEAIGCLNLAHDIFNANSIPTIELTKIHRQAQKSGIIVASSNVREGINPIDKNFEGVTVLGELQDMIFDVSFESDTTRERTFEQFKKYYESDLVNDIMDIQVLAPVKERGNACVLNLNNDIQEFYNPQSPFRKDLKISYGKDKHFVLREKDKVMCVKNNYKTMNLEQQNVYVFNGWVGTIKTIDFKNQAVIVYFPIISDNIIFTFSDAKSHLILGYASTVHKYEGSSCKVIIGAIDYTTPPQMLTKELVYTLLTRAEKECILIVQGKALAKAVKTSGVSNKNTFLVELLDRENI